MFMVVAVEDRKKNRCGRDWDGCCGVMPWSGSEPAAAVGTATDI